MNAEQKANRIIDVLQCLYFGLVPFLPVRDIVIGPTNLLNWLAVANLLALLIVPCRNRVWSCPGWSIASGLLVVSWAIGLMRAPAFAQESAILWSGRFAVPWLMLLLSPLDRRHLRLLCASWFAGLCLTAIWQYFAIANFGLEVNAYSQYSYSRSLQNSQEEELAMELGVYNTYGCMAQSIAAACALALAFALQRQRERGGLGLGSLLLLFSAWTGRFIASDLLSLMGVILAVGLALVRAKNKFSAVLLG